MEYLYLAMIGLLAGTASGLLGIGGSVVILPCLAVVYPEQSYHQHAAAAMIVNSVACLIASLHHHKAGYIQKNVVIGMIPAGVVSICIGVWVSNLPFFVSAHPEYLSKILAVFLGYVILHNIIKLLGQGTVEGNPTPDVPEEKRSWRNLLPGLMMGMPAGLLGIGGGVIAVPAQQLVLGTRLRNAIANSTALIVFTAAVAACYKNYSLTAVAGASPWKSIRIAAIIAPAGLLGGFLGAKLMHVSPVRLLRIIFVCYLLWAMYSQWTR